MKRKVTVNLSEVCDALENTSSEVRHYLDLETGEVVIDCDYYDESDKEKIHAKIEQNPDRYERIPNISSWEAYRQMENFIDKIEDKKLQDELSRAIRGRGAFRRFKDVLAQNPEEQISWYDFKDRIVSQKAKEWLEEIEIEVEEKSTPDNWVEEEIKKKREQIEQSINMFVELASKIDGIVEVALFGSLTGEKRIAKDIDLLVFIENTDCIGKLARCHRKVLGRYHASPDTFVFTKDRHFLGNICHRKECPSQSVDCQVPGCGKTKYIAQRPDFVFKEHDIFKNKPKILWLNSHYRTSITEEWYNDVRKKEQKCATLPMSAK